MQPFKAETDRLEQVLTALGPASGILARERGAYSAITRGATDVVIFGYGFLGKLAIESAINAGLNVVAVADNNKSNWGQTPSGVPIISPREAVELHNECAAFIVAIFNSAAPRRQLAEMGCARIVPYPVFHWEFSPFIPMEDGVEMPHRILESADEIWRGYRLLADAASREEFASQIQWRCSLDYDCLAPPGRQAEMYYAPDLVRLIPDEVLVDCGAFDGDSIRAFLGRTDGAFRRIYAFEPDVNNRARLQACVASLPADQARRIEVLPFGVSDRNETVSFNLTGAMGSRIVADGVETIECRKLDGLLDGPAPTFIKMDIEGAELEGIQGAAATIRKARPIMAVCAYHKCDHLWKIPILLSAILPEYRVFFRRYAEESWETMYYAIPPERLIT